MTCFVGHTPPDFYVACHSDVRGWGGGLAFATGLQNAFRGLGYEAIVLGVGEDVSRSGSPTVEANRLNLPSGVPDRLWRVHSWLLPRCMARQLEQLTPPRVAFVTVSPTWVVAARRAWPGVPRAFVFACLLTNCLPFTWPRRRRSIWQRLHLAGVRRIETEALASADLILAPTQQAVDEIRAFMSKRAVAPQQCPYGVDALPSPLDARTQQRKALGLRWDDFLVLVVGVCDRNKGFELAVRAWPHVDRRGQLVVIGDGPERARLEHLTAHLGQTDRIRFVGVQRDMAAWYAAADGVVSTSRYDTFPNVLLEAMSVGLPIIVPQHDPPRVYAGMAEVVAEHRCGLLYARSNTTALATAVNRLVRDRQLATTLGSRGRQAVRERYRWSTTAARILRHFGRAPCCVPTQDQALVASD